MKWFNGGNYNWLIVLINILNYFSVWIYINEINGYFVIVVSLVEGDRKIKKE